jgi:hypothetical protein
MGKRGFKPCLALLAEARKAHRQLWATSPRLLDNSPATILNELLTSEITDKMSHNSQSDANHACNSRGCSWKRFAPASASQR